MSSILVGVLWVLVVTVVAVIFGVLGFSIYRYITNHKEQVAKTIKLLLVSVAMVLILLIAIAVLPPLARAESDIIETTVKVVGVEPVDCRTLRVCFEYNGEILSWYEELEEDEMFDTTAMYKIKIFCGVEVVDACIEGGV